MFKRSLSFSGYLLTVLAVIALAISAACSSTTTTTISTPVPTTVTSTVTATGPTPSGTPAPVTVTVAPPPSPTGPAVPPEVIQYAADWPLPQGNYESTRATFTSTINSSNVNTLGLSWTMPLAGATSTNPLIMGNNVFLQDNAYNIWSIDFATGKTNWQVTNNKPWIGPTGVAVGWGKVFASATSYDLAAWDMNTGKALWETPISNVNPNVHSDIQPIVYNNMVFTSAGPHVGGTQYGGADGYLWGIDQSTGKVNWTFSTTDSSNLFGHPELNDGSGAWFPPSIDLNSGIIYWGLKNPGGFGYGGAASGSVSYPNAYQRPGPNLYSNCIIAQDSANGKLLWYNQTFPHDLVDHDFMNTPMLMTAPNMYNMLGPLDIAIGGGKAGVVYAFDRTSGSTLWSTPVGKHQNDTLGDLPLATALQLYPGVLGGIESHMAYADGIIFVPYDDLWTSYNAYGLQKVQPIGEGTGGLAALDVNTGKIIWDNKLPSIDVGAATVVNDLVFTSTYDGTIYAFKRADGSQVWKYKLPNGINSWPAFAKDAFVIPAGVGANPILVEFKLGASGTIPTPPPPSPTVTATPSGKAVNITVTAQNIVFDTNTITAPAGATVNITFTNNDAQVPHNIAFYTDSTAATRIFIGQVITGPDTVMYTFTAPNKPGTYFFRCDVHPTVMTGTFTVTP